MAVALRLTRMGRKKRPYYRIIAIDSRRSRDSVYLERLGYYHPLGDPAEIRIDAEKALKWLRVGAQPSETVRSLFKREGIWMRFTLEKRGIPENQIEEAMIKWFAERAAEVEAKNAIKQASKEIPLEKPAGDVKEAAQSDTSEAANAGSADDDARSKVAEKQEREETPSEKPAGDVKEAAQSDTPEAANADSADEDAQSKVAEKQEREETPSEKPIEDVKEAAQSDAPEASNADSVDENAKTEQKVVAKEASDTEEQPETTEKADASDDIKEEAEAPKE